MLIIGVVADFVQVVKDLAVELVNYNNEDGRGSMLSSDWKAAGSSKLKLSKETCPSVPYRMRIRNLFYSTMFLCLESF